MTLVEISRRLKIPVSTVFETIKEVEKVYQFTIVLKETDRNILQRDTIRVESGHQVSIDINEEESSPISLQTE